MSTNPDNLKPQPPPVRGTAKPTWRRVVSDCSNLSQSAREAGAEGRAAVWRLLAEEGKARDAFGAEKYGTRHQHDNGRDHARDAYQEALDGMTYAYAECERRGERQRDHACRHSNTPKRHESPGGPPSCHTSSFQRLPTSPSL